MIEFYNYVIPRINKLLKIEKLYSSSLHWFRSWTPSEGSPIPNTPRCTSFFSFLEVQKILRILPRKLKSHSRLSNFHQNSWKLFLPNWKVIHVNFSYEKRCNSRITNNHLVNYWFFMIRGYRIKIIFTHFVDAFYQKETCWNV